MEIYELHLPTEEDIGSRTIKLRDPYLISGARVLSGLGNAVVTAVDQTQSMEEQWLVYNTSLNRHPCKKDWTTWLRDFQVWFPSSYCLVYSVAYSIWCGFSARWFIP